MPWLQQAFPVEVAHVYAMTLIGRGFLIEPVPVAASRAAHRIFLLSFCRNHKASSQHRSGTFLRSAVTRTLRLVGVATLPAYPSEPFRVAATRRRGLAASSLSPPL